ncbi:TetR/AcrR family transcriptional regulator [bacterium]|nr:TetR/AcrR family transcriptional regulator [bacterium]
MEIIKKPRENIIQDTKQYIIGAARNLFSEYSYLGVSMDDIAKKLNITKAALYYHFTGKAEIYIEVLNNVFDKLSLSISEALSEKTVDKKLHKLIRNYLDFGLKEKNLVKSLMLKLSPADPQIKNRIAQLREQIIGLIQPVIKEMSASKKITRKVDDKLLTSLLVGTMNGLILEYSFLNKKIKSGKVADQIIAALF